MISILFTLCLLSFILIILYLTGLTILRYAGITDKNYEFLAPTLGLAFLTIAAQNLVYLNVPLKYSSWIVILLILTFLGYYLYRHRFSIKKPRFFEIIVKQKLFVLLCVIVILSSGMGIFRTSSQDYIGGGTRDHWNYTATSQFLIDYPFSYTNIDHNPYLALARNVKYDRIGVSVLQGFIASTTNNNAKTVYGVVSMLGIILLAVNLWLIGLKIKIKPIHCFFLAGIGSTLPGISYLLVDNNNFAHIVSLPFMYILPLLFNDLLRNPKINKAIIVGIILSGANSIYSDISPIYLVLALGLVLLNLIYYRSAQTIKSILMLISAFILALVFNLGFINSTIMIFRTRVGIPMYYPEYALKLEGLYRIWNQLDLGIAQSLINLILLLAVGIGLSGLILLFILSREKLLPFGMLILIFIPIFLLSSSKPYPYQFYKILISTFPFLILGIINIKEELQKRSPNLLIDTFFGLILLIIFGLTFFSTIKINKNAELKTYIYRIDKIKNTLTELEASKNKNLLIITDNKELGSWLSYHARYNRIYLLKDFYGAGWDMKATYDLPYLNLRDMVDNNLKVINLSSFEISPPNADQLVGAVIENEEFGNGRDYYLEHAMLTKRIDISLWTKRSMNISLTFNLSMDKAPETPPIELKVGNTIKEFKVYDLEENKIIYYIQAEGGVNKITMINLTNKPLILSNFEITKLE